MRIRIAAAFAHAFLVRLTLIALLVGAAVPLGWMPNPDGAQSGSPIVICTGHGPITAFVGGDGKPSKPSGSHSDICVFAAAAAHATPVATPALAIPHEVARATTRRNNKRALVRTARYRPQAARAPPLAA
jgi:hypothetical protein